MKTSVCMNVVLFLGIMHFSYLNAQIPKIGLVADYSFTGNSKDSSGNGNHATTTAATLTTDRFNIPNSAYEFDGTASKYIEIPSTSLQLANYTYSVWLSLNSMPASSGQFMPFSIGSTGGDQHLNAVNNVGGATGNGYGCGVYNSNSTFYQVTQNKNLQTSKWTHVVVVRSGNALKLFIDGVWVVTDSSASTTTPYYGSSSVKAIIGARFDNTYPFNGKIDDLRIYNRVLDSTEVLALFNEKKTNTISVQQNVSLSLYPNPSHTTLTLKFPEPVTEKITFTILDSKGAAVIKERLGFSDQPVDISSLPPGLYIIQINGTSDKYNLSRKFVID